MTSAARPFARDPRGPSETAALRDRPQPGPSRPTSRADKFTTGGRRATAGDAAREQERYRIADLVRLYRKRRMSQAEAATALHETVGDMRDWESGDTSIPRAVRERMAALYGLDPKLIGADSEVALDSEEWAAVLVLRTAKAEAERQTALATTQDHPDFDKAAARNRGPDGRSSPRPRIAEANAPTASGKD